MAASLEIKNSNGSMTIKSSSSVVKQPGHINEQNNTSIEDLYKYFGILADAKDQAGQYVETYLKIVSGTKSGPKEKQLASQFMTRFFKYFPKEMPMSIDAIFDLCEDEDVTIRKAAIKDLATLCKDCTDEHLNRIADILTQLLQTDDPQEFSQVQTSLLTVFKQNPKLTLNEIFNQINTADLEEVRKRAIKFLVAKVPAFMDGSNSHKDLEDLIVKHVKQVLLDVDAEEFILFIRLLTCLPSMNTLTGRQDLVNIIMSQSELDKPFDSNDVERLMILLSCIQQAIPLFSKNVHSTRFVNSYIENVLVVFSKLNDDAMQFEILKSFAELCVHYNGSSSLLNSNTNWLHNIEILYNLLIEYLPKPSENEEQQQDQHEAKFNFSYVECLIYSFHILAKFHPEFLAADENKEKLKDFRVRLQYFAKGTQNYIKELRNSLSNAAVTTKENEENKIRRVALKVTTNIDILIKDLFHNPPSYKSQINLSWKLEQKAVGTNGNNNMKRSLSVDTTGETGTTGANGKKKGGYMGIYHPPSGKYSTNNTTATDSNGSNQAKRRTFSNGGRGRF